MKPGRVVVFSAVLAVSASAAPMWIWDLDIALSDLFFFYFGQIQGLQQLRVWSPNTGASSVVSLVFMGLALFPDSQIRTTHQGLITPNPSAVNDPRGGSNILIPRQWCNYSAFIKVSSNTISKQQYMIDQKCFLLLDALLTYYFIYFVKRFHKYNMEVCTPWGHTVKRGKICSDNLAQARPFIFIVPLIVIEFFSEVNPSWN